MGRALPLKVHWGPDAAAAPAGAGEAVTATTAAEPTRASTDTHIRARRNRSMAAFPLGRQWPTGPRVWIPRSAGTETSHGGAEPVLVAAPGPDVQPGSSS